MGSCNIPEHRSEAEFKALVMLDMHYYRGLVTVPLLADAMLCDESAIEHAIEQLQEEARLIKNGYYYILGPLAEPMEWV